MTETPVEPVAPPDDPLAPKTPTDDQREAIICDANRVPQERIVISRADFSGKIYLGSRGYVHTHELDGVWCFSPLAN